MSGLFLFNPENDIALAANLQNFTPPRQALSLHRAGAMFPFWLGEKDDYILVESDQLADALHWRGSFAIKGLENIIGSIGGPTPITAKSLPQLDLTPRPWGWSTNTIEQFRRAGISSQQLQPYSLKVERYRQLSHRRNQILFLKLVMEEGIDVRYPLPICTTSVEEVNEFIMRNGIAMVKSPWSSSGRGVFPVSATTFNNSQPRIDGIIRKQGSVMVEPFLEKILDFALLFNINDDSVKFEGFSIFQNTTSTNYGGNIIAPDPILRERLLQWCSPRSIDNLIYASGKVLGKIYGNDYTGPVGIDMMVYRDNDLSPKIAPCIEVNLRYTMGFVARGIAQKTGLQGVMSLSSEPNFRLNVVQV